jgi:hypothetical protein
MVQLSAAKQVAHESNGPHRRLGDVIVPDVDISQKREHLCSNIEMQSKIRVLARDPKRRERKRDVQRAPHISRMGREN